MLRFVHELSAHQQVVLTAADPLVASLLRDIAGSADVSVVTLGTTAAAEPVIETTGERAERTRRVRVLRPAGDLIRSTLR